MLNVFPYCFNFTGISLTKYTGTFDTIVTNIGLFIINEWKYFTGNFYAKSFHPPVQNETIQRVIFRFITRTWSEVICVFCQYEQSY